MKKTTVVFDMDGTILNTLDDLMNSVNFALKKSGFPERSLIEIRAFVGNGIKKLVERAVPENTDDDETDNVFSDFKEYYVLHCADKTKPYDGITETIKALREKGYKTAVVSNKAHFGVEELVDKYFKGLFDYYLGEQDGIAKKPAPDMCEKVLNELGVEKQNAVYVGDSEVDILTAKNSGLDAIIVEWGFRDKDFLIEKGATLFAHTPNDILSILDN